MRYSVSNTAEYGDYTRGPRIVTEETRQEMKKILREIQDGHCAREWILENRGGAPAFKAMRRRDQALELERVGKDLSDVALLVPHQANKRIIDAVGQKLGIDAERVYVNVRDFGNTGSASVPFALWQAREKGLIAEGDFVALTAFGAGFHWAAAGIQF